MRASLSTPFKASRTDWYTLGGGYVLKRAAHPVEMRSLWGNTFHGPLRLSISADFNFFLDFLANLNLFFCIGLG
jgi:hypothetical protein